MFSSFLKLNSRDFVNGLIIAIIAAIGGTIYQAAQTGTFDVFTYDWGGIGKLILNATIIYLAKKLLTAENGAVLGKWGGKKGVEPFEN